MLGEDPNEELVHDPCGGGRVSHPSEGHSGVIAHVLLHHLLTAGVPPQVLSHIVHLKRTGLSLVIHRKMIKCNQ
jgi:hypothetical protein